MVRAQDLVIEAYGDLPEFTLSLTREKTFLHSFCSTRHLIRVCAGIQFDALEKRRRADEETFP
jgi:hypothetical protein